MTLYDKNNNPHTYPLLPDHYTLETLSSKMENMFKEEFKIKIPTHINQPNGSMIIYNTSEHRIMLDTDLAELFGVDRELRIINYVKRQKFTNHLFHSLRSG